MWFLRAAGGLLLAALPSCLKILLYRLVYGHRIGRDVKIGFGTMLLGVGHCQIGDHVRIGCFNLFLQIGRLDIADHARIGPLNLFRGGQQITIGAHASILRLNVLNSILQPVAVNPLEPVLELGDGVVVSTGHWLDFTDRMTIGEHTVIGGRGSSFWTHNRQRTRPITIGPHCYLGSDVRVAPGVEVASSCVVALGSVLTGRFDERESLIAGNPARLVRPLRRRELFFVTRTTRNDVPPMDTVARRIGRGAAATPDREQDALR